MAREKNSKSNANDSGLNFEAQLWAIGARPERPRQTMAIMATDNPTA